MIFTSQIFQKKFADGAEAAHEDEVVQLVEVPLVVEEAVDDAVPLGHATAHALASDVDPIGEGGADQRQDQRATISPRSERRGFRAGRGCSHR
jgi:hypothetical protein